MLEREYKWQAHGHADFFKLQKALQNTGLKLRFARSLITDSYFDNAEGKLSSEKSALRLRSVNGSYELTLKTSSSIKNGFAVRKEETVPLYAKSHTRASAQFFAEVRQRRPDLGRISELFLIKNKRESVFLENPLFNAEVCFDDFNILAAGKNQKMYEIEMEFKGGDFEKFAEFAQKLEKENGLKAVQISKVASAYKLLCSAQ